METETGSELTGSERGEPAIEVPALVVVWCRDEPRRVGEVLLPSVTGTAVFGRGDDGSRPRLRLVRQRPGINHATPPLGLSRVSREQLEIQRRVDESLEIRNLGRRELLVNGEPSKRARAVREGDVLELRGELMFLVARRPVALPDAELPDALVPEFGHADAFGMVGESPLLWQLRAQLLFAAQRPVHVLIGGPSGTGKELAARAIHALSQRSKGPWVARNAATFPETLIDAELFGNARDYPNPGMPARPGLVGAADGGTLFLDEIGELPHSLQAHLLRMLDSGEYQRLGEPAVRRSDLRLVAATNRGLHELKHDLAARLRLRLELPGLDARREDVGLLIPALIRRMARGDPLLARRFFPGGHPSGHPRVDRALVRHALGMRWSTHVRELETLLWTAMMHSIVAGHEQVRAEGVELESPTPSGAKEVDPASLSREAIETALAASDGVQDRAWRLLGLRNRFQLIRLIKKHGLVV